MKSFLINIEKTKNIIKKKYLPFVVLFVLMLILHSVFVVYGDDTFFSTLLEGSTMYEVLKLRYLTWSSRTIIEFLLICILQLDFWVWKILDCFIVIILAMSLSKIINYNKSTLLDWAIVLMILIYDFHEMITAGWAATTLNYLWPFTLGIYSLVILFKMLRDEKIMPYEYVLSLFAAIIALNVEQMCVILIVSYIFICCYLFSIKKNIKFPLILTLVGLAELIYILTSPGNKNRTLVEWGVYLPEFKMLTFIDKVTLGFASTMQNYFLNISLVYICLTTLIAIFIWKKYIDKIYRILGTIPFLLVVIFNITNYNIFVKINEKLNMPIILKIGHFCAFLDDKIFFDINDRMQSAKLTQPIHLDNFTQISAYLPIIIFILALTILIIDIYLIFENKLETIIVIGIILIGIAARMIMGFSPTVFASNTRTFIYTDFSFIITCILMLRKMIYQKDYKYIKLIYFILGVFAIINYSALMLIFIVMY